MVEVPVVSRPPRWLAPLALLLGGSCLVFIWIVLALYLNQQLGWMALLGAVDAALMLRFGGMARGIPRALTAALATVLMMAVANWGIAASQLGFAFGLNPWDSALLLGFDHAWLLSSLANHRNDLIALALAPLLAAWLAR